MKMWEPHRLHCQFQPTFKLPRQPVRLSLRQAAFHLSVHILSGLGVTVGVAGVLPGRLGAKAGSHSVGAVKLPQQTLKELNGCTSPHPQLRRPHLTLGAGEEATKKWTGDGSPFIRMGARQSTFGHRRKWGEAWGAFAEQGVKWNCIEKWVKSINDSKKVPSVPVDLCGWTSLSRKQRWRQAEGRNTNRFTLTATPSDISMILLFFSDGLFACCALNKLSRSAPPGSSQPFSRQPDEPVGCWCLEHREILPKQIRTYWRIHPTDAPSGKLASKLLPFCFLGFYLE